MKQFNYAEDPNAARDRLRELIHESIDNSEEELDFFKGLKKTTPEELRRIAEEIMSHPRIPRQEQPPKK